MRFAETGSTRAMIVVGALSVLSLAAATWELAPAPRAHEPRPVRPMRGCGQTRRAVPPPVVAPVEHHNNHADTLIAARDALTSCMHGQTVAMRLALDINAAGRVTSVEVKAMTDHLAQMDMHVVKCVNAVVSPLVFPRGDHSTRISTHLSPR
jgi:hypothetical protein